MEDLSLIRRGKQGSERTLQSHVTRKGPVEIPAALTSEGCAKLCVSMSLCPAWSSDEKPQNQTAPTSTLSSASCGLMSPSINAWGRTVSWSDCLVCWMCLPQRAVGGEWRAPRAAVRRAPHPTCKCHASPPLTLAKIGGRLATCLKAYRNELQHGRGHRSWQVSKWEEVLGVTGTHMQIPQWHLNARQWCG